MGASEGEMGDETVVLRVDRSGVIVGVNEGAKALLGQEILGKFCDRTVRGVSMQGVPTCEKGCAARLACGEQAALPARDVRIRQRSAALRCTKVGDEVVVVADRVESFDPTERLTPREREVLKMVGPGLSSAAIAGQLGISPATVRTHVEHALGRLGAKTRAEAVLRAMRTGQLNTTD